MAGKLPYMPFYPGDWLKEPSLRVCSHEVKGVYIDMLCLMWECEERGVLATAGRAWSNEDVARAVGGDLARTLACVVDLLERRVVSRRENGAIYSRRMVRDQQDRADESAKKQKQRKRKAAVPPDVGVDVRGDVPTHVPLNVPPDVLTYESEVDISASLRSKEAKGQAEGQAERLYELYPRKVGRGAALKAIAKALTLAQFEVLEMAVTEYAASRYGQDEEFTPHPATWFNQQRWLDDRQAWKPKLFGSRAPADQPGFDDGLLRFAAKELSREQA